MNFLRRFTRPIAGALRCGWRLKLTLGSLLASRSGMNKHNHSLAVYNGRILLGFIVEEKPQRWASYDGDRRFLGEYPSRNAALNALYKKETEHAATGASDDREEY